MSIEQLIDIQLVDVPDGRRVLDPDWIAALGEDMRTNGQATSIEVVAAGDRFRLIAGGHRLGGMRYIGNPTIRAIVKQPSEFANEAAMKLSEIAENFKRRELSILDRAFDVAAWREIYEAATGTVKRGRRGISSKLATNSDDDLIALSEQFSGTFSEAARKALKLSRDAIFRALKIASINQGVRERLSLHPIADNQSELLALAAEPLARQTAIANLFLSQPPAATKVADAIAIIDRLPPVDRPDVWERLSVGFAKLSEPDKRQFFIKHWAFIETMIAEGKKRA